MRRETHNDFIGMIHGLREEVKAVRIESMELDEREQELVDAMPLEWREEMEHALSKFTPDNPEYDFRMAVYEKAYAVFMTRVLPYIERAYKEGAAYG